MAQDDVPRFRALHGETVRDAVMVIAPRAQEAEMRVLQETVCVEVRDTGRGIGAKFLPRVFDRYTQEGSSPRDHAGLGLGLSIARKIVELHGGSIAARSAGKGEGASFSVTLLRAAAAD